MINQLRLSSISEWRTVLHQVVERKGRNYVDPTASEEQCVYMVRDDVGVLRPSCLFGHALIQFGVPKSDLDPESRLGSTNIEAVLQSLGVTNKALIRAALAAQDKQDGGSSWGDALDTFDSSLRESEVYS